MILRNNICVFDFETGGKNARVCDPIQIAAVMINPNTLDFIRDEKGEPVYFNSMMRPDNMDLLEDEALAVNKKTREEIAVAPVEEVVFKNFANWLKQFNSGKNDQWSAPIAAGYNIANFDMIIIERLCHKYAILNKENKQNIFHKIYFHDVMQIVNYWFHGEREPSKYNMGTLRQFLGMSTEGAHDALQDTIDTAKILIKFMKLIPNIKKKVKLNFKDAFKRDNQ